MHLKESDKFAILSAIVPVTRMSGRLDKLERWLTQAEGLPIEIIIIHDIQDENTSLELRRVIGRHKNLEIIFREGQFGSPGAARNAGLILDLKKWVVFWDSDDLPRVRQVMEVIEEARPTDEVLIGNYSINTAGKSINKYHSNNLDVVALNPGLWRMVFRSELMRHMRFEPIKMGEDQIFLVKLNLQDRKVHFAEDIFYNYYVGHPAQLTSNAIERKNLSLPLIELMKLIDENSNLRNSFSEIVKIRLFLTLIKNQSQARFRITEVSNRKKQFRISTGQIVLVLAMLVKNKFSLLQITAKDRQVRRP